MKKTMDKTIQDIPLQYHDFAEAGKLRPRSFSIPGKVWAGGLILIALLGGYAYLRQLREGLAVTAMRDYAFWGIYISNFVFFVAISLVGSLVTAVLRLSRASWSFALSRIAEMIAVAAIIMASLIIIVDMGRPDRILHIFLYGRLQSPIVWDVLVITTYLAVSVLLLYFPLIPDLYQLSRDQTIPEKNRKWYRRLSLKWTGEIRQREILRKSIRILAVMIIPLALGIHTVTAWLFATTYRPGWDSTNFGPYFVSGAFVVGAGAVVVMMYVLRRRYNLGEYITAKHFDRMGKLLVLLLLVYLYFNINEYLVPAYKMRAAEEVHLASLFSGSYSVLFYSVLFLGMIIPAAIMLFPAGRRPKVMFVIGILVVTGAWFKRYLIVTPTLLHPFMPVQGVPESWMSYSPTWEEWAITAGSLSLFLLLITLMVRFLPIIPIDEIINHEENETN